MQNTNSLVPFTYLDENDNLYPVRTVIAEDGEPWFVANDVARVLGYSVTATMTRSLDDDAKGVQRLPTRGGAQSMTVINESGLYSAILSRRRPEAKAFKKWITGTVLPTIRKTGSYSVAGPQLPDFSNPATAARAWADEYEKRLEAETMSSLFQAERDTYSSIIGTHDHTVDQVARLYRGVNSTAIKSDLMAAGYLYRGTHKNANYRVYRTPAIQALFYEKTNPNTGQTTIYATAAGKEEIGRLYREGQLTMKTTPGWAAA